MSKDQQRVPQSVQQRPAEVPQRRAVEPHRQCPLCYGGLGGVGQANGTYEKASTLTKRYYKCDRCAHTWVVSITPEQVKSAN